ncbi:MAG: LCP family protein [Ilumatobacteraceae bacterium]|nr:LCP family protein [Acidimicrobiaceae bacterium]
MLALDTTPLPRRRRLPGFVAIAVLTTVVCAAGTLIAARRVVDDVPRVQGVSAVLSGTSDNVENFLLVGSDSRALGDPNTGETGEVTGNRSDTIMVLRVDKGDGSASLLSIPRDLWVDRAGHDSKGRINSSFNDGPAALVQTVQQGELGIPIHHYVEIDFSGFKALVDALGGVQVCFWYPTRDFNTGLDIPVGGCYILDGTQGLAYARSRHYEEFRDGEWHEDPTSDLGRSTRQRAFVNASLQTALAQVKANPFTTGELVGAIGSSIRIDDELDPIGAAASLRTAVGDGLLTYSLPVVPKTIDGNAVLLLGDGAESVLQYFRGRGPAPAPST